MRINGKYYKVKDNVLTHMQGIILLALAYMCYHVGADEAGLVFAFMGILMACPYIGKINRCLLWIAKKIVRQGHRREY